ncbi:MAG TPA: L-seryl-tRNA(Sec) selenium transferase [Pyrinomonadaceae bacterium]|nr:L-seryl-tRNA(Sec) selenium transferase [Pyrinomonadaceae bacterium]
MGKPRRAGTASVFRMLPSTDELLQLPETAKFAEEFGHRRLAQLARQSIDAVRQELAEASAASGDVTKDTLRDAVLEQLKRVADVSRSSGIRKVINATGVVVHTNLGRAPLSDDAIAAVTRAAGYCNLEYDISTGGRGKRGANVESVLAELAGAEDAVVVNNCAAAAFLVLSVFAKDGETIVSRGELVEIGGDFRVPDVLTQSGSRLKEVGTTNRTKLSDYAKAVNENTKLVMRVHPSNYRIIGFTEKPSLKELAELAHKNNLLVYEDAGSGAIVDLARFGLGEEPMISRAIVDGADIVTFSGDKLLGSTQAGIAVGRRDLIKRLRTHSLYRTLRADKLVYAALEATAAAYIRETAERDIPVLRMLSSTRDELESRAGSFVARLRDAGSENATIELIDGDSVVGGGSAPGMRLGTVLIAISHASVRAEVIELKLRMSDTPVVARIENDRVVVDLRTVDEGEEDLLLRTIAAAIG